MNINNIEEELRLVLRDKRFKLSNAGHKDNLINRIEDILKSHHIGATFIFWSR